MFFFAKYPGDLRRVEYAVKAAHLLWTYYLLWGPWDGSDPDAAAVVYAYTQEHLQVRLYEKCNNACRTAGDAAERELDQAESQ